MTVRLQLGSAQATLEGIHGRIIAGRDPSSCQLADGNPTLSRKHAEIFVENGVTYVHDLGSANGTWVDGAHLSHEPMPIKPGQQVYLGHVPLGVHWEALNAGTMMATEVPPELKALIEARKQAVAQVSAGTAPSVSAAMPVAAQAPQAAPQLSASGSMLIAKGQTASSTPTPQTMAYRRQGANSNGTLLLALPQDTWFNGSTIDGFVEFTSIDNQTVASITVELVQFHKKGSDKGHFWDRMLVRQGPWRAAKNDVLPLPFSLRVPAGVSMTSRDVSWEIRADVDINWGSDIHADLPINMRNQDIERFRDGLGALDYRVVDIESAAIGQHFQGEFAPPAHLASQWGVNKIELVMEYLGTNLKVKMKLDRKGLHKDPVIEQVYELDKLRHASQADVNGAIKAMLDALMPHK